MQRYPCILSALVRRRDGSETAEASSHVGAQCWNVRQVSLLVHATFFYLLEIPDSIRTPAEATGAVGIMAMACMDLSFLDDPARYGRSHAHGSLQTHSLNGT